MKYLIPILRYLLALVLPPLAILLCKSRFFLPPFWGKTIHFILNLIMWVAFYFFLGILIWIPMLHAIFIVRKYMTDKRVREAFENKREMEQLE